MVFHFCESHLPYCRVCILSFPSKMFHYVPRLTCTPGIMKVAFLINTANQTTEMAIITGETGFAIILKLTFPHSFLSGTIINHKLPLSSTHVFAVFPSKGRRILPIGVSYLKKNSADLYDLQRKFSSIVSSVKKTDIDCSFYNENSLPPYFLHRLRSF